MTAPTIAIAPAASNGSIYLSRRSENGGNSCNAGLKGRNKHKIPKTNNPIPKFTAFLSTIKQSISDYYPSIHEPTFDNKKILSNEPSTLKHPNSDSVELMAHLPNISLCQKSAHFLFNSKILSKA